MAPQGGFSTVSRSNNKNQPSEKMRANAFFFLWTRKPFFLWTRKSDLLWTRKCLLLDAQTLSIGRAFFWPRLFLGAQTLSSWCANAFLWGLLGRNGYLERLRLGGQLEAFTVSRRLLPSSLSAPFKVTILTMVEMVTLNGSV